MRWEVQWRQLAGTEEMRDVLHLDERHVRLLVLDSRCGCEIDEPDYIELARLQRATVLLGFLLAQCDTVPQRVHEVSSSQPLSQNFLNP
jgi:hypothetical protein